MSVSVGKFHLFERSRRGTTYYYYWFEQDGKCIQKACGHGCNTKRTAVAFLENLLREELLNERKKKKLKSTTLAQFAESMFTEGAPHLARWEAKGKILKPQTVYQHRRHLVNYLIPQFGNLRFDEIKPADVEDFLLEQRLSNSCRNTIMYTMKLILQETKREGIIESVPEFEPFKRSSQRQDVLSAEELAALFPYDFDELVRIWRRPGNVKEPDETALMFGTLFCVTVSAGLRSGEIRALHREQILIHQ